LNILTKVGKKFAHLGAESGFPHYGAQTVAHLAHKVLLKF